MGGQVLSPDGKLVPGTLLLEDTRIAGIALNGSTPADDDLEIIDVTGCIVSPGFIDTHVHGGGGRNFMEGTTEALAAISRYMVQGGVTSCLATTTSAPQSDLERAIENLVSSMKQIRPGEVEVLGVHLEGPFINPKFRGVHVESHLRHATLAELESLYSVAGTALRVVTLAPEMPFGMEAIRYLSTRGVCVSIGHTGASYEEAKTALQHGGRRGTHVFNAMPPIHHRNPGPVIALFEESNAYLEFIVDGHHVHPSMIAMAIRQIGIERAILITDCTDVAGKGDGTFTRWEGTRVVIQHGQARTLSGSLAGSTLRMDQGVKNLVEMVGVPLHHALRMASENPAKSVGVFHRKGSLEPGKDADVVVLDSTDLSVVLTIIGGQISYDSRHEGGPFHGTPGYR
jgi:N-acetylglucosamine-6-phosphate deacetylase